MRLYDKIAARASEPRASAICATACARILHWQLARAQADAGDRRQARRTLTAAASYAWRYPKWWHGALKNVLVLTSLAPFDPSFADIAMRLPERVASRLWRTYVRVGALKERALRRHPASRMPFVPYSWSLNACECPCDVHFCESLEERNSAALLPILFTFCSGAPLNL